VISFARIAIQTLGNPLQLYFVIAVLFIAINYLLGRFAEWVARRLSRARATSAPIGGVPVVAPVPAGTGTSSG